MFFSLMTFILIMTVYAVDKAGLLPDSILTMLKDMHITKQLLIYITILICSDVFFLSLGRLVLNLIRSVATLVRFPGQSDNSRPTPR